MKLWQTNVGRALHTLGSGLMGYGVAAQLSTDIPNKVHTILVLSGYVIQLFGDFFNSLFAPSDYPGGAFSKPTTPDEKKG